MTLDNFIAFVDIKCSLWACINLRAHYGTFNNLKELTIMVVFKENKETGLSCGINDDGELFLGNDKSGYNLPDTKRNREYIIRDFNRYNAEEN